MDRIHRQETHLSGCDQHKTVMMGENNINSIQKFLIFKEIEIFKNFLIQNPIVLKNLSFEAISECLKGYDENELIEIKKIFWGYKASLVFMKNFEVFEITFYQKNAEKILDLVMHKDWYTLEYFLKKNPYSINIIKKEDLDIAIKNFDADQLQSLRFCFENSHRTANCLYHHLSYLLALYKVNPILFYIKQKLVSMLNIYLKYPLLIFLIQNVDIEDAVRNYNREELQILISILQSHSIPQHLLSHLYALIMRMPNHAKYETEMIVLDEPSEESTPRRDKHATEIRKNNIECREESVEIKDIRVFFKYLINHPHSLKNHLTFEATLECLDSYYENELIEIKKVFKANNASSVFMKSFEVFEQLLHQKNAKKILHLVMNKEWDWLQDFLKINSYSVNIIKKEELDTVIINYNQKELEVLRSILSDTIPLFNHLNYLLALNNGKQETVIMEKGELRKEPTLEPDVQKTLTMQQSELSKKPTPDRDNVMIVPDDSKKKLQDSPAKEPPAKRLKLKQPESSEMEIESHANLPKDLSNQVIRKSPRFFKEPQTVNKKLKGALENNLISTAPVVVRK